VSRSRCQAQSWAARLVGHFQRPQQLAPASTRDALDFTRRLLSETLDWYRNADLKSQILLTLDGAFLAFLTASAFKDPKDLRPIVVRFGPETWLFLGLMTLTLSGSIASALLSLRSRGVLRRPDGRGKQDQLLEKSLRRLRCGSSKTLDASVNWSSKECFIPSIKHSRLTRLARRFHPCIQRQQKA
jgi:hypothetical protein